MPSGNFLTLRYVSQQGMYFLPFAHIAVSRFSFYFSQDGAMDEHYGLISDHIEMIRSQQQGQDYLAASNVGRASDLQVEEWSSDEEEKDADQMDI